MLLLVTPYLAEANNGNWRTAARWSRMLAPHFRVIVQAASATIAGRGAAADVMVALHARRSHPAIAAWHHAHPDRPLVVALTGTDLYRDVPAGDAATIASMTWADRLIVLQDDARLHVPVALRDKAQVVYQSARTLVPWPRKRADRLHCVLVAHLRDEKDPATAFGAWWRLAASVDASLTIIGAALDPALGRAARDLAAVDPRVQWVGPRAHSWTRQAIKRAHLLIVSSRMEGGANVVVEAVTSGTPVLASRISGNVGMLGEGYPGYFPVGGTAELAALVARAARDRTFLASLDACCRQRAPRFAPAAEASALVDVLTAALRARKDRMSA